MYRSQIKESTYGQISNKNVHRSFKLKKFYQTLYLQSQFCVHKLFLLVHIQKGQIAARDEKFAEFDKQCIV